MKRKPTGLSGLLAINKPTGVSSHDVVNSVRRITGERRVGHAGTLDPMACGLLLVGVGSATRLSNYLIGHDKSYCARIVFGVATDTDDACGHAFGAQASSAQLALLHDESRAREVLDGLLGESTQLPPAYSAIKKNGVTAYKAARAGKALELEPRAVTVYAAELLGVGECEVTLPSAAEDPADVAFTAVYWDVALRVSKGTYIRSIARDLGVQLGCGAHLGALTRTAVADMRVSSAVTLDELAEGFAATGELPWCDPVAALGFPQLELMEAQVKDVECGRTLDSFPCEGERGGGDDALAFVACTHAGRLLAIYERADGKLKPATVFSGGVAGVK